jgi:hypothetical protein
MNIVYYRIQYLLYAITYNKYAITYNEYCILSHIALNLNQKSLFL